MIGYLIELSLELIKKSFFIYKLDFDTGCLVPQSYGWGLL